MSFLTAGYETTAQALAFAAYHIATDEQGVQVKGKNQFDSFEHLCCFFKTKQERLLEEIDLVEGDLTYEKVQGMTYLDMVLMETFR